MQASVKFKLNETEFRKIVNEELKKELIRDVIISEGYEPEVADEIVHLKTEGIWDTAKDIYRTGKAAVGAATDAVKNTLGASSSGFKEKYRQALATDVQKAFQSLHDKYSDEKILSKAGLDKQVIDDLFKKALNVLLYGAEEVVNSGTKKEKENSSSTSDEEEKKEKDAAADDYVKKMKAAGSTAFK